MGKSIKIYDLAVKMIHLSGNMVIKNKSNQKNGIRIKIIGLRQGEKLYEELFSNKNFQKSAHPKIFMLMKTISPTKSLEIS